MCIIAPSVLITYLNLSLNHVHSGIQESDIFLCVFNVFPVPYRSTHSLYVESIGSSHIVLARKS